MDTNHWNELNAIADARQVDLMDTVRTLKEMVSFFREVTPTHKRVFPITEYSMVIDSLFEKFKVQAMAFKDATDDVVEATTEADS